MGGLHCGTLIENCKGMTKLADCCCEEGLDTSRMATRQKRVLIIVLAINLVTFLMMVGGSVVSGSSALLSGTLDNFGDSLTYAISFAVVGASAATKGKVAFFKGCLIMAAAIAVAFQIGWRLTHPAAPLADVMGLVAALNLAANILCLALLTPLRHDDVNMASVWECSRNDVFEGVAVIVTAGLVWLFQAGWPDLVVATLLLLMFLRSAFRVMRGGWREMHEVAV